MHGVPRLWRPPACQLLLARASVLPIGPDPTVILVANSPLHRPWGAKTGLSLLWQFKGTFREISVGYEFRIGKAKRRRYLWKRKNCQSSAMRLRKSRILPDSRGILWEH